MVEALEARCPGLQVVFSDSPPFRPLTPDEDADAVQRMRQSGLRILFVGLGCPKQEAWMASHRHRIPAVMLGVGAAFDFIGGTKSQAPRWMQRRGLEWAFRLAGEPRRLWRRYLRHNPRFVFLLVRQLAAARARGFREASANSSK
jgi:N-acetylglucosaminyldiphosphoundecaprenol N-acetyl-beta-D-mannosaminyltransferase